MTEFRPGTALRAALFLLLACIALRLADVFWIRSDEWFGEQFVTKALGLLLVLLFAWRIAPIGLRHFPLGPVLRVGVGVSLAVIAFVALLLWGGLALAGMAPDFRLSLGSEHGMAFAIVMLIGLNMMNAVMEEGLFRGVLLRQWAPRLGALWANAAQAALFGLWHLVWPLRAVVDGDTSLGAALSFGSGYVLVSALIGFYWGWLTLWTRSLWPAIIAHGINNAVLNILLMDSTPPLPMIATFTSLQVVIFLALLPFVRRRMSVSEGRKVQSRPEQAFIPPCTA